MRFKCKDCDELDLCEECYDIRELSTFHEGFPDHNNAHEFEVIELPERAGGFEVHQVRCQGCLTFPIIGYRFCCQECVNINLCKKKSIFLQI